MALPNGFYAKGSLRGNKGYKAPAQLEDGKPPHYDVYTDGNNCGQGLTSERCIEKPSTEEYEKGKKAYMQMEDRVGLAERSKNNENLATKAPRQILFKG